MAIALQRLTLYVGHIEKYTGGKMTNYVNQRFQRFKFLFNFVFVLSVLLRVLHCERCRIRTRDHSLLDLDQ